MYIVFLRNDERERFSNYAHLPSPTLFLISLRGLELMAV